MKIYGKENVKPKINWEDRKERGELLSLLVSDARKVLSHLDDSKEDLDPEVEDAAKLLAKIVSQDTEKNEQGEPRIRKGVAKDRIISTTAPEEMSVPRPRIPEELLPQAPMKSIFGR